MADSKSSLARDGTMQVTAKEGIGFLEAAGKDKLLEMQGLKDPKADKPALARDGTMIVTAKEADALLGNDRPDQDAKTRGQNVKINEKEDPPAKKPRMAKGVTMIGTAQEAEAILGGNKPDADAMTRGQQKKIDEISKETPPTPSKKSRMSKEGTMAATAKEAKAYYIGKDKLGDTRSESKALKQTAATTPKKMTSIAKTIGEAAYVVPDINVNEGRKTRSQSNPKPSMKRAGTMQQTAKDGKEYLKRGRKSKKAAAAKIEEEAEDEEEEVDDE
ncbi:uncharacterized protein LOC110460778 [Mizuhopecten yessoensis]|uniref:Uncharacterized protein n=1 Tax=Mizuhopecten yessoensis TaxID=6573 RepID=A0A210R2W8_MIZYE|nr:uncharacterized protein LOC110460778 [Mizuhopecten yessoensis]OWF55368.1 hypothetical protein KP79_PYT21722 [Mizuhopecten yessoensis]